MRRAHALCMARDAVPLFAYCREHTRAFFGNGKKHDYFATHLQAVKTSLVSHNFMHYRTLRTGACASAEPDGCPAFATKQRPWQQALVELCLAPASTQASPGAQVLARRSWFTSWT